MLPMTKAMGLAAGHGGAGDAGGSRRCAGLAIEAGATDRADAFRHEPRCHRAAARRAAVEALRPELRGGKHHRGGRADRVPERGAGAAPDGYTLYFAGTGALITDRYTVKQLARPRPRFRARLDDLLGRIACDRGPSRFAGDDPARAVRARPRAARQNQLRHYLGGVAHAVRAVDQQARRNGDARRSLQERGTAVPGYAEAGRNG